jgi:hypothetical protein
MRTLPFICLTLLTLTLSTAAFTQDGWTIGGGFVSSERVGAESDSFFPTVSSEQTNYMLLPNLSYRYQQWSVGADGIGWRQDRPEGINWRAQVGYPSSQVGFTGQRGWFRYGLQSGLSYSNGVTHTGKATIGPFEASVTTGFGERADDLSQSYALGFPLYINQDRGITVIGSAGIETSNAAFIANDLQLDNTPSTDALNWQYTAFSIFSLSPKATLLLSGTLQRNDDALVEEVEGIRPWQVNTFLMFSYFLGQ